MIYLNKFFTNLRAAEGRMSTRKYLTLLEALERGSIG